METKPFPVYPQPFFELQFLLAQKVSHLSHTSLSETLLHYTAFYRIFGLDWSMDPSHPTWQAYLQGLAKHSSTSEQITFTYHFYLERFAAIPKFTDQEHWGCFTYDYNSQNHSIKLHFSDEDSSPYGPLSHQRIDVRKAELRAMFHHIQQQHPAATLVLGGSWLYHWQSYTRLFPPAFGQSATPQAKPGLTGRAIWGQFLRRGWTIHPETIALFLQRVSQLKDVESYPSCFPYPVLLTRAPIQLFYPWYDI